MKIEKINKRIEEIDKNAVNTVKESEHQIEVLSKELENVSAQIEETYRSGDIAKGQDLAERKAVIESKIGFLKTFLAKRNNVPLIDSEESKKLRSSLNDELYNVFYEQKRKADQIFNDMQTVCNALNKAISDTREIGNDIIRLSKSNEGIYPVDNIILVLNRDLNESTRRYKNFLEMLEKK